MTRGYFFQISKEEYKKAMVEGVQSIIGKHETNIVSADVEQAENGTYWLSFIREVKDGK